MRTAQMRTGRVKVTVMVNGAPVAADVEDRMLLVHFLRETAGLTATNVGCDNHLLRRLHGAAGRRVGEVVQRSSRPRRTAARVTTLEGLARPGR